MIGRENEELVAGRYLLEKRIGSGGMAEIFRAIDTAKLEKNNTIALKRIHPLHVDNQAFRRLFFHEAEMMKGLHHPSIPELLDFGEDRGMLFIALEYVEGENLKRIVDYFHQQLALVPLEVTIFTVLGLCEALFYIHCLAHHESGARLSIIHRDVTPHNVFITYEGRVMLLDFGIAKPVSDCVKPMDDAIQGKIGYMAPEHFIGLPIDHRADIFSCGTIFYELLSGRRLFKQRSEEATINEILKGHLPSLKGPNGQKVHDLEPIFRRACAKDLNQRYASAKEMRDELMRAAQSMGFLWDAVHIAQWMAKTFSKRNLKALPRRSKSVNPLRSAQKRTGR